MKLIVESNYGPTREYIRDYKEDDLPPVGGTFDKSFDIGENFYVAEKMIEGDTCTMWMKKRFS